MHLTRTPIRLDNFFTTPGPECGALASFVGMVRNQDHDRAVLELHYEAYEPMAEKMITKLIQEARACWPIADARVIHRIGTLAIGEVAVAIAVSAGHRDEAFAACRFLIEEIKKRVPIWKKETFRDGTSEWVRCHTALEEVCK